MKKTVSTSLIALLLPLFIMVMGLLMAACPADGNGEGQRTLPSESPQNNTPVVENPPETGDPASEPPKIEGMNEETERRILEDYVNFLREQGYNLEAREELKGLFRIDQYYGTYNGSVVFMFNEWGWTATHTDTIDGISFHFSYIPTYPGGNAILVWKEGQVYELCEAYNAGFLTREDLETIAFYYHNRGLL